jgi:hypothetical protein
MKGTLCAVFVLLFTMSMVSVSANAVSKRFSDISVAHGPLSPSTNVDILPLTNIDILQMLSSGLTAELIIAKIASSNCNFDTFPSVLSELRLKHVPADVLMAMVHAPNGPPRYVPAAKTMFEVTVPDGTIVEVELRSTISSDNIENGDLINFTVVHPVRVKGVTVINKGARASGHISKLKKSGSWGRAGKLGFDMSDVTAIDDSRIPLGFGKKTVGNSHGGGVATGVVLTSLVFWPAAPLWGFKKGDKAEIPAGKRFEAYLHGDSIVIVTN